MVSRFTEVDIQKARSIVKSAGAMAAIDAMSGFRPSFNSPVRDWYMKAPKQNLGFHVRNVGKGVTMQGGNIAQALFTGHGNHRSVLGNVGQSLANVVAQPTNRQAWSDLANPRNVTDPFRRAWGANRGLGEGVRLTGGLGGYLTSQALSPYYSFKQWAFGLSPSDNPRTRRLAPGGF